MPEDGLMSCYIPILRCWRYKKNEFVFKRRWFFLVVYFFCSLVCFSAFLFHFLAVLGMRAGRCQATGATGHTSQFMFYLAYQRALGQPRFGCYRLLSVAQAEQCPSYTLGFRTGWGCCNNSGTSVFAKACSNVSWKERQPRIRQIRRT